MLLLIAGSRIARYVIFQSHSERPIATRLAPPSSYAGQPTRVPAHLVIPRINIDLEVLEGDDDETLSLAPGHLPSSATIGSLGNAVIAGHRDMAFRGLRFIRLGDEVRVTTNRTFTYRVVHLKIVKPDDLRPLQPSGDATLTIITCYPFRYVGPAPDRYIVTAKLVNTN